MSFHFFNSEIVAQNSDEIISNVILQTSTSWDGSPIHYPEGEALITAIQIEIPAGSETGWHHHPVPSFAYVLEGKLELTLEDGRSLIIRKGEALAEVTNTIHTGKNVGDTPLKLIVFYTGSTNKELTIMRSQ